MKLMLFIKKKAFIHDDYFYYNYLFLSKSWFVRSFESGIICRDDIDRDFTGHQIFGASLSARCRYQFYKYNLG